MAIIDEIPGFEVTILVDGTALHEYPPSPDDNDDTPTKTTKYIVAEPGKTFIVRAQRYGTFKHADPNWDLSVGLSIDGEKVKALILGQDQGQFGSANFDGVDQQDGKGSWSRRKFMFSDLVFDNAAKVPTSDADIKKAKTMGEIRVTLRRGTMGDITTSRGEAKTLSADEKVHEKSLKGRAMSRKAGLGQAETIGAPRFRTFVDHDVHAFAEFKFRYRSMQDLKAEMIVPRSPSPVPLEERPDEDLSREELMERLEQQRAANARIKAEGSQRIKRERSRTVNGDANDGEDDEDAPIIINSPPKRPRVIESIDLTGD